MNKILRNLLFDGVDGYIEELKVELATTEDSSRKQEIIKELYNLEELKNKQKVHKIKGSDILKAGVGVLTVVAVLKHEETNIITSKIWGFATGLLKQRINFSIFFFYIWKDIFIVCMTTLIILWILNIMFL